MNNIPTILQIQPHAFLIIGLAIVLAGIYMLWPRKGGLALIAKLRRNNKRVLMEDALKYIFDCEYNRSPCDVNNIAGNLNISNERAGKLIGQLASLDLIIMNRQSVVLTDSGRSYALRVVRIHRIWERYFADQTSVDPADWHDEADRIEHTVSAEETEKLAAQMGYPLFDPHGDPIPTADGKLPEKKGKSLGEMQAGEMARIIHLEDEPRNVFEQLLVLGLYPGMQIYVTGVDDKKISFVANGEESALTPFFAGFITVEPVADNEKMAQAQELLSSLKIGESAEVTGISPNCRGQQRKRLMDLGIVPGSSISAVMKSASGDPVGYRVLGTTIGLRKLHADYVFIKRKEEIHEEHH